MTGSRQTQRLDLLGLAIAEVLGDKLNDMAHELTGLTQEAADDPADTKDIAAPRQRTG